MSFHVWTLSSCLIFCIKAHANLFRKRKNEAPGESTVKKGKLDHTDVRDIFLFDI
jgi:hypothetical protein